METIKNSNNYYKTLAIVRHNAMDAIRGILNERLTNEHPSINLDYYSVNGTVDRYNFLGVDGNGYGRALAIFSIEKDGEDFIFNMADEDGDGYEERNLADFNAVEVVWILDMLEQTFEVIDENYNGKFLSKYDYDYDDEEE